ncbi:hypothetical protein NMY22_g17814 [Coprinellus aureogranulatus]|nr:hypothetical protein NMY22_g17814 [Coprinellus aureogranulatus]
MVGSWEGWYRPLGRVEEDGGGGGTLDLSVPPEYLLSSPPLASNGRWPSSWMDDILLVLPLTPLHSTIDLCYIQLDLNVCCQIYDLGFVHAPSLLLFGTPSVADADDFDIAAVVGVPACLFASPPPQTAFLPRLRSSASKHPTILQHRNPSRHHLQH